MFSNEDSNKSNQKLIQFKSGLRNSLKTGINLEWIFKKLDNIDMKVEPTNYLKVHHPHLIGSTALHLTYDCAQTDYLKLLLNRGADFTIKNQTNLTILHTILRFQHNNQFRFLDLRSVLDDKSVNMVLSAHLQTKNSTNPCDGNGMSHFHIACMANNVELVKFFLDNNVFIDHAINTDSPYFAGFTGLHLAIRCCCLQVTKVLLKRGASIHHKSAEGMTAYHMVMDNYLHFVDGIFCGSDIDIKSANEEIAKLLLKMFSNDDDSGLSCLHLASAMMDTSVADKLAITEVINDSINVDSQMWPGYTALHFAAQVNISTVKMLVKKGADLMAENVKGQTPLDLCIKRCKTEQDIYEILLSNSIYKGIAFTRRIKLSTLIDSMREYQKFKEFLNNNRNSSRISVSVDASVCAGFTPLHVVVLFSCLGNFYENNGEKYFRTVTYRKNDKIFHEATDKKYLLMITELLKRNESMIIAQDNHGRTPVHLAFRLEKPQAVVEFLLNLHTTISSPRDLIDDENLSLLHIACSRDDVNLVEKLLVSNKNINLAYKGKSVANLIETGWTPLHIAVASDSVNVIKILLKYGANIYCQDLHGVTPIHLLVLRDDDQRWCSEPNLSAAFLLSVPNLKECVVEDIGLSHLHAACFLRNAIAVKKLLDSGSNINLAITSDPKITNKSFEFAKLVKYLGYTPINMTRPIFSNYRHFDYRAKKEPTIDVLFQYGADVFVKLEGMPFVLENLEYFYTLFKDNVNLQRQLEAKIGFTNLHHACFFGDLDSLKKLLDNGENGNAQLNINLPIWAGYTPLHMILNSSHKFEIRNEFVRLLLCQNSSSLDLAQGNKITNPSNVEGTSYLHIACNRGDVEIVKKLLEHGNVDVNQPADFFNVKSKRCRGGFTALHFAAISCNNSDQVFSSLKIIDLLFKHGADPSCQSSRGQTPLHVAHKYEIFERIARESNDVNAVNVQGDTPLGCLFTRNIDEYTVHIKISADRILSRLRSGCYYNVFNLFTEKGYIGMSINEMPFEELQNLLKVATKDIPDKLRVDDMGRTAIHNVVACKVSYTYVVDLYGEISIVEYASLIELLMNAGYDIDSQDYLGRTALHMAAKFENSKAISALLMAGADVNIPDKEGKTAMAYHVEPCKLCRWYHRTTCDVFEILANHVLKLQHCKLEVSQLNRSYITNEFILKINHERLHTELEEIKKLKIEPCNLTLKSLISEIDAVSDYPTMPQCKKDAISEFFGEGNINSFREKFSEVAGLLSLQYRKAVKRGSLIDEALVSLNVLAKFPVPDLCSRIILGFLSNNDLKNLITSTNCNSRQVKKKDSKIVSRYKTSSKNKKRRKQ